MKHGGRGKRTPLKPGDWVEWTPTPSGGKWDRLLPGYIGQTGIVYIAKRTSALVRFPDLSFHRLRLAHLTWIPSRRQRRATAARLHGEHMAYMRTVEWRAPVSDGNPHTFTDGPRRYGSVPGSKD